MDGSATLTIETSRMTTNCARQHRTSVRVRRRDSLTRPRVAHAARKTGVGVPRDRRGARPTRALHDESPERGRSGLTGRTGGDLLSQALAGQVPSALRGLTALFGMGRGVSPSPSPPETGRDRPRTGLENCTVDERSWESKRTVKPSTH